VTRLTASRPQPVPATAPGPGPARTSPARKRRRLTPGRVANYAFIALIMFVYLFPLAFLINTALKSDQGFYNDPVGLTKSPDFGNFPTAWSEGNFGATLINSLIYTICAAGLGTVISLVVAVPVSRGYVRHSRLWYLVFVLLLFLPNILVTQFQLVLRLGLYNTRLGYILIMASTLGVGPLVMAGYMKSVPRELDEAAAIDGMSYGRYLLTFIPRLIKPVIATVFILQAISVWNDIIVATILLVDPGKSPITLGLYSFQGQYTSDWGLLAAATMIVAGPIVVAYVFLQRYLIGGVLAGAVKG
jgi:raffinose/stachyose/melibiose transport system permease protein